MSSQRRGSRVGRVRVGTDTGIAGTLTGTVEPLGASTPYARAGDAFAWLCLGVVVVTLALARAGGSPGR